ncbi:alpha/beta hydrolase [Thermoplasma sp.]|uniref:alpha/beta hydrolase n=1 Tax=Thermoplasma sp. TaxID=1973142 RepID=UPI001289DFC9|nr:alpha/beta hydrolase [Thermoplasma sp.]KAA8922423.1 MAG: alpha/beta hydrolase [Thermoplasma sp.]
MAIDPAFKKLLEMLSAANLENLDVYGLRRAMNEYKIPEAPEKVYEVRDYALEYRGVRIRMRLYVPDKETRSMIVYYHGGGFVFGDIDLYDNLCRKIANRSHSKVISVEYRLAPESKFPAAVDDAYEAYRWIRENARDLGIDESKIAIGGDSAGGNLTAAVTLKIKDTGYVQPRLQVLFYPALGPDFFSESLREYGEGYFLTRKQMDMFGQLYFSSPADALNPYFAPILYNDLSGLPEAIIVTAELDPLRDQGEMYLKRLYDAGVIATGIRAKGMIHGFLSFAVVVPAAENVLSMVWSLVGLKIRYDGDIIP